MTTDQVTLNVIDILGPQRLTAAGLDDTPYKVNYIKAPSSVEMGNAFNAGQIDIGVNSDIGYSTFFSEDLPVTVIRALQRPGKICGIVVLKDSPINSVSDLVGKNLANTVSAGSEFVAHKAFENIGRNIEKDSTLVNLDAPTDGAAALLSGRADAWLGCGVPISRLIVSGEARYIADGSQPENSWIAQTYWGVADSSLQNEAKKEAILDYIDRVDSAIRWGNEHVEELSKAESELFQAPYDATLDYNAAGPTIPIPIDVGVAQGLQESYDRLASLGRVVPGVSVADHLSEEFNNYFSGKYDGQVK